MVHNQLQHRAGYQPLVIQEDFLAICEGEKKRSKAIILSILEQKLLNLPSEEEYVTLSYRQFEQAIYGIYGYNTTINSLTELEHEGLIEKRPNTADGGSAYQYRLYTETIQSKLDALPERYYAGRKSGKSRKATLHVSIEKQLQGKCTYCGVREATTIDHLIPLAKGGFTVQGNLVPACLYCNSSKNDTDVREWLRKQGIQPSELLQQMIIALYGKEQVAGGEK